MVETDQEKTIKDISFIVSSMSRQMEAFCGEKS
jgi:hypothetical protein